MLVLFSSCQHCYCPPFACFFFVSSLCLFFFSLGLSIQHGDWATKITNLYPWSSRNGLQPASYPARRPSGWPAIITHLIRSTPSTPTWINRFQMTHERRYTPLNICATFFPSPLLFVFTQKTLHESSIYQHTVKLKGRREEQIFHLTSETKNTQVITFPYLSIKHGHSQSSERGDNDFKQSFFSILFQCMSFSNL